MNRWIERWNRYWFPRTSTLNLACCRIIAVAAELIWFFPSMDHQINLLSKNSQFSDPQPIIRLITLIVPRDVFFTPTVFQWLHWLTVAAGVLAIIGLFTRVSLFVFAVGIWIFVSHAYSYADLHHPEALYAIFLMLLAFSPAGESLSVDALLRRRKGAAAEPATSDTAMWPLKLTHVLLALTYFSTGATKLLVGGLGWMNGYTVQIYTFGDALQSGHPFGVWLAQHHTLCVLLGAATVLFELFYFVSLFLPRLAPLIFVSAILFHLGLLVAAGQPFFEHILLNALLLLFLDPEWFPAWLHRLEGQTLRWRRREQAQQAS